MLYILIGSLLIVFVLCDIKRNCLMKKIVALLLLTLSMGSDLDKVLRISGNNRSELKKAIKKVPMNQLEGMTWLLTHMPDEDLKNLSADFLLSNCELAYNVRDNTSWGMKVPTELFLNYILPYANLNERVEDWRLDFYNKFYPIVKDATSSYEAVALLNQKIFKELGVIYSTARPKADQSPYESIDAGMASCTGLSILLIDVCRSVGIPARFVGTPLWHNNSGNHSWVEIWDGQWHFTGAAEPTGDKLNDSWFRDLASKATKGSNKYGIFAATWEETDIYFPMNWLPNVKKYNAIDVTDRYATDLVNEELVPIRIRALDSSGNRQEVKVRIFGEDDYSAEGISKGETCDVNDHLTFMLPKGKVFTLQSREVTKMVKVVKEEIIDLGL